MATLTWSRYCGSSADLRRCHDPASKRRAGVAGDRSFRHAEGLSRVGAAGAGSAATRSAERSPVLLSWTPWRSDEGDLARRPGGVPVHEETGERSFHMAVAGGRLCIDLTSADELSFVRHRLAPSA